MEFTETKKGCLCLVRDGYCYRKRGQSKTTGAVRWQCVKEKKIGCKGSVVCLGDKIISAIEHKCAPDEDEMDKRIAVSRLKKRAREEPNTSIAQVSYVGAVSILLQNSTVSMVSINRVGFSVVMFQIQYFKYLFTVN